MTAGMRAGALVLIVAATVVIGLIARYGYRMWSAEGAGVADPPR